MGSPPGASRPTNGGGRTALLPGGAWSGVADAAPASRRRKTAWGSPFWSVQASIIVDLSCEGRGLRPRVPRPYVVCESALPPPRYRVRERAQTRGKGSWNGRKRLWAGSPRDRRGIGRRRERLQVRHQPPDRLGRQHAPEGRHATRPAVIDGLKDGAVGPSVAPAPIGETRPQHYHGPQSMTAEPNETAEQLL